ncbi:MAG TPA: thrombospondin type 3 repeat-containing protein [Candidatus Binatia bacterium]|nr:thrombospondin type 3 repeat-containing protein [Candidatus Binatia bacterium]
MKRMLDQGMFVAIVLAMLAATAFHAAAQSIVLYSNDFESPNEAVTIECGNSLDQTNINQLYGGEGFTYHQQFTVEAVIHDDSQGLYSDPEGNGGAISLGMQSAQQDDLLALTFDRGGREFINVGFDLSSIDVNGCGGPFGVAVPIMRVSLLDSPGGTFAFNQTVLDTVDLTGIAAPDQWTFAWTFVTASLDASGATDDHVSVLFDVIQSGYLAFDNLSIVAADEGGIVDTDTDGIADDEDNCPFVANPDQADLNENGLGDLCECNGQFCGDPSTPFLKVTAVDAGYILRAATGLLQCELCLCDTDGSGVIVAADALRDLQYAVGLPVTLDCAEPD